LEHAQPFVLGLDILGDPLIRDCIELREEEETLRLSQVETELIEHGHGAVRSRRHDERRFRRTIEQRREQHRLGRIGDAHKGATGRRLDAPQQVGDGRRASDQRQQAAQSHCDAAPNCG
jgi:hypothetical protein